MAGRALTTLTLLALLAGSSVARADNENSIAVGEPSPDGQREAAAAPPKLLGSGKGTDGTHVFLFGRKGAPPVVFMGQPGDLKELEVLGIERFAGKFIVDTFERGEIHFNTPNRGSTRWSVTIPGEVGFTAKNPTVVLGGTPDRAVFLEAMQRMGYVRRTPLSSQTLPSSSARVVESDSISTSLAGGDRLGPFTMLKNGTSTMKARKFRRPVTRTAKMKARGRTAVRARAPH